MRKYRENELGIHLEIRKMSKSKTKERIKCRMQQ